MNKFYDTFKKVTKTQINKFKSFKKPYKIIIPSLIVAVILIAGIIFYVDYNKTPILTLSNLNKPVLNIDNSKFTIRGSVDLKNNSEVMINGSKVKLNSDGSFSHTVDLSKGKNDITITVTRNDKKITSRYTINYTPKSTEDVQDTSEVEQTSQDATTDKGGTTQTNTSNTSTGTPKPAPAPAPTPTPPPATFQVSSVTVSVSPTSLGTSQCSSYTFEFTGIITATAAGTVNYYWQRTGSDAGGTVPGTLVFSSAGSQYVNYSWNTNLPTDGGYRPHSAQLVVTSPNSTSSQATFSRASC